MDAFYPFIQGVFFSGAKADARHQFTLEAGKENLRLQTGRYYIKIEQREQGARFRPDYALLILFEMRRRIGHCGKSAAGFQPGNGAGKIFDFDLLGYYYVHRKGGGNPG